MHHKRRDSNLPVVRAFGQFGPMPKSPRSVRLFLDDARNPPFLEKGWVVVRTVDDGIDFLLRHGHLIIEVSLDNDLGPDPQGYKLLEMLLTMHKYHPFEQLRQVTIHTGNLPKWRKMVRMLRGSGLVVKRRVPSDLVYPNISNDKRNVVPYKKAAIECQY